jgi:hypothetical protein
MPPSSCLPEHVRHRERHIAHSIHPHTQNPQERKPKLCTCNTQFTNPKENTQETFQPSKSATKNPFEVKKVKRRLVPRIFFMGIDTEMEIEKKRWVEARVQERLWERVLSGNWGCEWGSRQVLTLLDVGTRYDLCLSQIQFSTLLIFDLSLVVYGSS